MRRLLIPFLLMSAFATVLPASAVASKTIVGRVVSSTGTSLSVTNTEILTFALDERTAYTKLITQKPWQEDTRLTAAALGTGRFVAVHVRNEDPTVAAWVQIATDVPPLTSVGAPSPAIAAVQARPAAPAAPGAPKEKSSDLLTSKQLKALIATAKTPADHMKLQKHYLALAAKYEADAAEHVADAEAYRKNPSFRESKTPLGPGTVTHCERFAELDRQAAKEARDLATAHEHMAAGAK